MDKSFVTMEQRQCIVCGKTFDTGALLLDKRLKDRFEKYTVTGTGLCPEHQKLFDEGYIALVEIDEKRSTIKGNIAKPEDAYRTGTVVHIRRTVAREIFNIPVPDKLPMMFVDAETVKKLQDMMPKDEGGETDGSENQETQS